MIKIGIISDTHNILREEVIEELKRCNYIIHAGDIMRKEIIDELRMIAPLYVVKGNNDFLEMKQELYFMIAGYRFYLVHQKGEKKDVDFYVYGHSHRYEHWCKDGVVYLNPGSCGKRRFSLPLTYMILFISDDGYRVERKNLV